MMKKSDEGAYDSLPSMPTSPENLITLLTDLDIHHILYHHTPLKTVDDSKAVRIDIDPDATGVHIKNIFLRYRKKRYYLLVAHEDRAVDMKALQALIGSAVLSFASADRLFEMLGVYPGSVSPLALINDNKIRK